MILDKNVATAQSSDIYKKIDNEIRADEVKNAFRKDSDTMLVYEDGFKECFISNCGDVDNIKFKCEDDGRVLVYGIDHLDLSITEDAYRWLKLRFGILQEFRLSLTGSSS